MAISPELATQAGATVAGLFQTGINAIKEKKAAKEADRIFKQSEADTYKMPQELSDILSLSEMNAAQGYSDQTLNYLTGQAGAGLANTLGISQLVGGDPNDFSKLLDTHFGNVFGIGAASELERMKKFDSVLGALQLVGSGKEAEWQSRENSRKNRLQTLNAKISAANVGQQSGMNLALTGAANIAALGLYPKTPPLTVPGTPASGAPTSATSASAAGYVNPWDNPMSLPPTVDPTSQPGTEKSRLLRRQQGVIIN